MKPLNKFPIPPGTILGSLPVDGLLGTSTMTPDEEALLRCPRSVGPVPAAITELSKHEAERADEQLASVLKRETPDFPKTVQVTSLPVDQQRAAYATFDQMNVLQASLTEPEISEPTATFEPTFEQPQESVGEPIAVQIDLTDADLQAYVVALSGGPAFSKTYRLFEHTEVTFADLAIAETDMTTDQTDADYASGNIRSDIQYQRRLEDYRLVASIKSWKNGKLSVQFPVLTDMEFTAEDHLTPLPELLQYMQKHMFVYETMRRVATGAWEQFQEILLYIESQSENPDFFYKGGQAAY